MDLLPVRSSGGVPGACPHDCPDTCAWRVEVEDGRAITLRADSTHPFTDGGLCAKVNRFLEERTYHPDRLLHPLRRTGPKGSRSFVRTSWEEAMEGVAGGLRRTIERHGAEAVLPYNFAGTQGYVQGMGMDRAFFSALGASRLDDTICGANAYAGLRAVNGVHTGILPEDIALSRFIVLWGTNTLHTNLHLWPFIQRARAAGAVVVAIDPVRTRTAAAADWHLQPLPGTDGALALGMLHVIVAEGLHDEAFLAEHAVGFEDLRARLSEFPVQRVAAITGLDAGDIVTLARRYATTRPATLRVLIGLDHHANAADMLRAIACLPVVTGAWRDGGGGILATAGGYLHEAVNEAPLDPFPDAPGQTTRLLSMVELGRLLTDPSLDPPIGALFVYNANPAATAANTHLVHDGLAREDLFTVVVEHFLTDTAAYADYVLPATTQPEHLDLMYSWGTPYLTLNLPAIPACGEALPNTEIFRRLAAGMGLEHPRFRLSDEQLVRDLLDTDHPWLAGVSFEELAERGWVRLSLPPGHRPFADGFPTPDGKARLCADDELLAAGWDPVPGYRASHGDPHDLGMAGRYPLVLLTPKTSLHFLNSSYSHVERHRRAEREPLLDIHPDDATPRGIEDGSEVRVVNERGEVRMRVRVGDRVRPGVVAMPSGWLGERNANRLTSDAVSLHNGSTFSDTRVDVLPCAPEPGAVRSASVQETAPPG